MAKGDGIRLRPGRKTYTIQVGVQVVGADGKKRVKVIERSLHTTNRSEARLRGAVERAAILERFAAIKAGMPIADVELQRIENEEMRRAYDLLAADFLNAHPQLDKFAAEIAEASDNVIDAAIQPNPILGGVPTHVYAQSKLRYLGREGSADAIFALSLSILKAHAAAVAALQRGVTLPPMPPPAPARTIVSKAPKGDALVERYLADRAKTKPLANQSIASVRAAYRSLISATGNIAFDAIGRADVARWVDIMDAEGLSPASINRHLGTISKMWKWCQDRGVIGEAASSPFSRHWRHVDDDTQQQPFTAEQLVTLFAGAKFDPQCERDFPSCLPWMMAIGLCTGLRESEITAAKLKEKGGYYYLEISRGKTRSARRVVPVHCELLRLGIVKFYATGGWPKNMAANTAKRFVYYRRQRGIDGDRLKFHSFRKSFTSALDGVVPQDTIAALLGHARGFSLDTYSPTGPNLQILVDAIGKLSFPGLKL